MIEKDRTYVVMGLLDRNSIAYAIGRTISALGGRVIYTVQSEVLKRRYLDSDHSLPPGEKDSLRIRFCDVSVDEEVMEVFADVGPVAGVVHSIAYANPATCLGEEFHTEAVDDVTKSYHVSCVSLATVTRHAAAAMPDGGAVVALSFDSHRAYALYNWMGVHKAALEALVRALARRHGRDGIRVNAVSAGPLATTASSRIPGFSHLTRIWEEEAPLRWDPHEDKQAVANAVVFLLGPGSSRITGQVLTVDGGVSISGGPILDFEKTQS